MDTNHHSFVNKSHINEYIKTEKSERNSKAIFKRNTKSYLSPEEEYTNTHPLVTENKISY